MSQRIVPALLPASLAELLHDIASFREVHELQIDVVDGDYVPFSSWPYDPVGDPSEVATALAEHSYEVDLMVCEQVAAAERWATHGAQTVIFHIPGVTHAAVERFAAVWPNISVAVALTAGTSLAELEPFVPLIDMVQLMGIATIGAQGMPFDERVLERIQEIRSAHPKLTISIDGSMNEETIPRARQAGADRFVVGSALLRAPDRAAQFQALSELVV